MFFHKYQGTGNDFIIIDDRDEFWGQRLTHEDIQWLCDRRFGIGADGLMLLLPHAELDFYMQYYNSDGRESSMCGNGGRCLVHFAYTLGAIGKQTTFEAIDGVHEAHIVGPGVRLRMSRPKGFVQETEDRDFVDTGSPHLLLWTLQSIEEIDVAKMGAEWRNAPQYAVHGGTNVNFINRLDQALLGVRTFERGVEAETLSCGTGVTASAYSYLIREQQRGGTVAIKTPGGLLSVEVTNLNQEQEEVWLNGPATFVYSGEIELPD